MKCWIMRMESGKIEMERNDGAAQRNASLDVFRGLMIFTMMLVDAPPDFQAIYPILVHSPWEGLTIADLAFPGFVFSMGASAAFSVGRKPHYGWREWSGKILRRGILLFFLGVLFNGLYGLFAWLLVDGYGAAAFYDQAVSHGRVFGVLQRLALIYMAGMVLLLLLKKERYLLLTAFFLLGISSAGFHFYAPEEPFRQAGNISQALDLIFPGADHVYSHNGMPFDPEGLYGTVAGTASMLFGVLGGRLLAEHRDGGLLLGGGVLLLAGAGWSAIDPISKPLWTSPYALLNAGADMLALAACSLALGTLPSVKNLFRPFCAFGRNPIFFYLATNAGMIFLWTLPSPDGIVPAYPWIWQQTLRGTVSEAFSAALYAFLWCLIWWPLAEFFRRRGIVFRI